MTKPLVIGGTKGIDSAKFSLSDEMYGRISNIRIVLLLCCGIISDEITSVAREQQNNRENIVYNCILTNFYIFLLV